MSSAAQDTTGDAQEPFLPPVGAAAVGQAGDRDTARDPRRRRVRRRARAREAAGAHPWPLSPAAPTPNETALAEAIQRVTASTQALVRDEIELAKLEVQQKVKTLGRGAAVGVAAGVFLAGGRTADPAWLRLAVLVPAVPRRAVLLGLLPGGRSC